MRYANIYSSFPCPASGHFSAASGRVAPIRASVLSLSFVLGEVQEMMCRYVSKYADSQTLRYVGTTKKPLSVVTLKEAVKIKLAATYSPAGVQYHRRGWA